MKLSNKTYDILKWVDSAMSQYWVDVRWISDTQYQISGKANTVGKTVRLVGVLKV